MSRFKQLAIAAANASMMVGGGFSQFSLGAPSGKVVCDNYPKRPGNDNVVYYADEKGNIRRSKRRGRDSL